MSSRRLSDASISGALRTRLPSEAPSDLRERIRVSTAATPQARRLPLLLGIADANRGLARYAIAAAAVIAIAVVGRNLLDGFGLPMHGALPLQDGPLAAGTYVTHPLPAPDDALSVAFTVPAGWQAVGPTGLIPAAEPGTEPPGGMVIQFIDVTTLNDPCDWLGSTDDVSVGPGVDDLVDALRAQDAYQVSAPVDVVIGGYRGKQVDIVMPAARFSGQTSTAVGCDEFHYRLWSTTAHGDSPVYAQGPENRWRTSILDVAGTRLMVVVGDFPGTSPADRAQLDAIVGSLAIQP